MNEPCMKCIVILNLLLGLFSCPVSLFAQKDSAWLVCPFEHGSGREPKEAYTWDPPDKKIVMISKVDSIVRSCVSGQVVNVSPAEDNKFEIVVYFNDYYFWYFGAIKSLVTKGQMVNARQPLGIYTPGTELEFRMFKHEEVIDPRNLLECKIPKAEE